MINQARKINLTRKNKNKGGDKRTRGQLSRGQSMGNPKITRRKKLKISNSNTPQGKTTQGKTTQGKTTQGNTTQGREPIVIDLDNSDMYFMMLNIFGHDPIHDFRGDRVDDVIKVVNELVLGQKVQTGGGNDSDNYLNDEEYLEDGFDAMDSNEQLFQDDRIFQDDFLLRQVESIMPQITILKNATTNAPIAWRTRGNLSKLQFINEYIRDFMLKLFGYYYDDTKTGGRVVNTHNTSLLNVKQNTHDKSLFNVKPNTKANTKAKANSEQALVIEEVSDDVYMKSQNIGRLTFGRYLADIYKKELTQTEQNFLKDLLTFTYDLYNILASFDKRKSFFHIMDTNTVYSCMLLYILRDEKTFPTDMSVLISQVIDSRYTDQANDDFTSPGSHILTEERSVTPAEKTIARTQTTKQKGGDATIEENDDLLKLELLQLIKLVEQKKIIEEALATRITENGILNKKKIKYYNSIILKLSSGKLSPKLKDNILWDINNMIKKLNSKIENMNKTPKNKDKLTPSQKETKNLVLKYIALGAINFIDSSGVVNFIDSSGVVNAGVVITNSKNKELVEFEYKKLDSISENGTNHSTYDAELFKTFQEVIKVKDYQDFPFNVITNEEGLSYYKKYSEVINNAVKGLHNIKGWNIICPYSSIADAQGTFGSCVNNFKLEVGEMNCTIRNEGRNSLYQVITKLDTKGKGKKFKILEMKTITIFKEGKRMESKTTVDVTTSIPIQMKAASQIHNQFDSNDDSMHSLSVKSSYVNIMKLLKEKFASGNPWESFENIDHYMDLIRVASRKGNGDVYQEINGVAENGGYVDTQIPSNKRRIGFANDQPSAVRSSFLLLNAKNGVNKEAITGFYGSNKKLVISRDNNQQINKFKKIKK